MVDAREEDNSQIFIDAMMQMHADDLVVQMHVYNQDIGDDRIKAADDRIKSLHYRINNRITNSKPEILLRLCEYVYVNPTATAADIGKFLNVSEPTVN